MTEDAERFSRNHPALAPYYPVYASEFFDMKDRFSPLPMMESIRAGLADTRFVDRNGERLRLECFLSLRKELNAYAARHDDQHFIGITYNKVLYSFIVCQEAFFLQLVFDELKDDVDEKEAARRELDILYRLRKAQTIDSLAVAFEEHVAAGSVAPLWELFDPVHHARRRAAWYVAQAIIELSLLHEMTHVLNGHCGYLRERLGAGKSQLVCLNETDAAANGLDAETLRWLEHEADFYAASFMTHDVIAGRDARRLGVSGFDIRTRVALITFAVCILSAIWTKDHTAEPGSGRHPHPLTRALTYLHGIELALLHHGDEPMRKGFTQGLTNVFVLGNYIPQMRKLGELVDMGSHWRERDAYQDPASPLKAAVERHAYMPEVAGTWPPAVAV